MPDQPRTLRVEAVVLNHKNWGEADRLITLFSLEHGKLRTIAKGARKLRSRKAGHLEPFTRVALLLARGRDLWIITQAETIEVYQSIRQNLVLTGYAAYVIEILDRFTYEEGQNPSIYKLIVETLQRLANNDNPFIAVRYYEINLLEKLGYRPELFRCVRCNEEIIAQDQFFSADMGGVVCPRCGERSSPLRAVSVDALRYIRHIQRSTYALIRHLNIPVEIQNEIEGLLQFYITFLLERALNSPSFIREVKRL